MKLHRQQRRGIWRAEQVRRKTGARVRASWLGTGGGLPSGLGRAGHIQPLGSDPLANWLLQGASCPLPRGSRRCSALPCIIAQVYKKMTPNAQHLRTAYEEVEGTPRAMAGRHTHVKAGAGEESKILRSISAAALTAS